ncbi:MAG: hypothetical protein AAF789_05210 [Bacteroidota bacterium]
MLRFFKVNDPYRLVAIAVFLVVVRLVQNYFVQDIEYFQLKWLLLGEWLASGFSSYSQTFDYTGPLSMALFKYLDMVFGRNLVVHHLISTSLIIYQAAIFNFLLIRNRAFDENTYLPAFLYVVVICSIPDYHALSPQLISLTFVLLVFKNVLRRINNLVTDELFANSGLYLGLATLFYLPSFVFFFSFLVSFVFFSSAIRRRIIIYFSSYFLVIFVAFFFYFWVNDLAIFFDSYMKNGIAFIKLKSFEWKDFLLAVGGLSFVMMISVLLSYFRGRYTIFQIKVQQVLWLLLLAGLLIFFITPNEHLYVLVFVVPFIAFYWTHYFLLLKRRSAKTLLPYILIFGLIGLNTYNYSNVDLNNTLGAAKVEESTLLLEASLTAFRNQKIMSPCFDSLSSNRGFAQLDFYDEALNIERLIKKLQPSKIDGPDSLVKKIFKRFPEIDSLYKFENGTQYTRINN